MGTAQRLLIPFLFSFILITSLAIAAVNETTTSTTTTTAPANTTTQATTTTTTQVSCSTTADGACPSNCAAGSDADCCANAGKYWITNRGCYNSPSYGTGTCTAETNCILTANDGCCPQWCAAGSDADCAGATVTTTTTTNVPTNITTTTTQHVNTNQTTTTTTTIAPVTSTVPQVCAQDVKQCSDGSFVSRNPNNNCEFNNCPEIKEYRPTKISSFVMSPEKVQKNNYVKFYCMVEGSDPLETGIKVLSPSGAILQGLTDAQSVKLINATEEGVYTATCSATDQRGGVASSTKSFFVSAAPIRQACPGECCTFEDKFEDKFCGAGFKCNDRACQKIEQPKETIGEVSGITTIGQILNTPKKFENLAVKITGTLEKGKCDVAATVAVNAIGVRASTEIAKDIVTGKLTATASTADRPAKEPEKCFPFYINDGTGRIGLIGFGGNADNRKIELKGIVKTYEISGNVIPFLKVEGHSESGQTAENAVTQVTPVFATADKSPGMEECHKTVRKYAIRLTHNKEVKNVVTDNDDLWNYLDANYQAVISNITATCNEEPEIVTDYLSRAIQNEISKNENYGSKNQIATASQTTDSNVVPLIIVMRDVSNTHLEDLKKASGLELAGGLAVEPLDKLTIIRMPAFRENVDAIRKLEFVEDLKVDSVILLSGGDITKTSATRVSEKLELSRDGILKNLEAIKSLSSTDDQQASLSASQDAIIQSSDSLQSFDNQTKQRGIGYTLGWLLGAAATQEKNDANFLNEQAAQLQNTINTLESVSESTNDITIRANLKEQIEILTVQSETLKKEAETKSKNAGGILAVIKNMIGG